MYLFKAKTSPDDFATKKDNGKTSSIRNVCVTIICIMLFLIYCERHGKHVNMKRSLKEKESLKV